MKCSVWCAALGAAVTAVLCVAAAQSGGKVARESAASTAAVPLDPAIAARAKRNPPLGDLPPDPTNRYSDSIPAAELGHAIFFDPRFSASGTVGCTTCHDPEHGFADTRPIAKGEGEGTRHSMTVLNAAHNRWFTWDGRADTLWAQALQPFETANEQNFPRARVLELIKKDEGLLTSFRNAYGVEPEINDASFALVGKAIAAYERHLVTGPSAYDRWWQKQFGDGGGAAVGSDAQPNLSAEALRGLEIFFGKGNCWQCHHGATFSDGEFHSLGIPPRDGGMPKDEGRYAVVNGVRGSPFNAAGVHSDDPKGAQARISAALVRSPDLWGRFKTPSLRGVASRGPYMHAGQFGTMQDVVRFYSTLEGATALDHHQEQVLSKLNLSAQEQADLIEFLKTLEGTPPAEKWRRPPARNEIGGNQSLVPQNYTEELKGTALTFDMVLIPGCDGQPSFYMGRTEVSWELFDVFVYQLDKEGGSTPDADAVTRPTKPYISMDRGFGHAGWPAISMSAHNAQKFCEWLSAKTGRRYMVPTLGQWECAVKAANIPAASVSDYAWVEGNAGATTHKLGTRKADQAGLHDFLGNAAEWIVEPDGRTLVVGGSYRDAAAAVGPDCRMPSTPDWNASDPQFPKSVWWLADGGFIGLRVVSPVPAPAPK